MGTDVSAILACALIGLGAGIFYFLGLWWTVRRLGTQRHPALAALGSFVLRAGVVLVVFYLAARGRWAGFLACMGGFLLARFMVTRRLRPGRRGAADGRLPSTLDG